jgi:hypothetical protein
MPHSRDVLVLTRSHSESSQVRVVRPESFLGIIPPPHLCVR